MVLKFMIRTNNWIHVAKTVVIVQNIFNIIIVLQKLFLSRYTVNIIVYDRKLHVLLR